MDKWTVGHRSPFNNSADVYLPGDYISPFSSKAERGEGMSQLLFMRDGISPKLLQRIRY